ncbi:unnamed protein product [Clavelina lepadiformis]|uniref:Uncharacterized protein n=1 Tax=Clavelina lepadiformis TaxID=159417 RepID=A0ABP0G062_CLALP
MYGVEMHQLNCPSSFPQIKKRRKYRKRTRLPTRRDLTKEFESLAATSQCGTPEKGDRSGVGRPRKKETILPDNLIDFILENESNEPALSDEEYTHCMTVLAGDMNRKCEILKICDIIGIDRETVRRKKRLRNAARAKDKSKVGTVATPGREEREQSDRSASASPANSPEPSSDRDEAGLNQHLTSTPSFDEFLCNSEQESCLKLDTKEWSPFPHAYECGETPSHSLDDLHLSLMRLSPSHEAPHVITHAEAANVARGIVEEFDDINPTLEAL